MTKTTVIYHGNCADGFTSAWVVRRWFMENLREYWEDQLIEFVPGVYQDAPPDVSGRNVIMVDFSYKRDVIAKMIEECRSLLIIDHHKSALEDLSHLVACPEKSYSALLSRTPLNDELGNVYTVFDLERSGAGLAWDFFFPDEKRPELVNRVEDRDLWRFNYEDTRVVQAGLFSHPYSFDTWDRLVSEGSAGLTRLAIDGQAIERKHFKDIDELLRVMTRPLIIGGVVVPAANLPYTMTSDAGGFLARFAPFAACYWHTPEGVVFSLRSAWPDNKNAHDVSMVATGYGGGGHPTASGFRVTRRNLEAMHYVEDEVSWSRDFWDKVDSAADSAAQKVS